MAVLLLGEQVCKRTARRRHSRTAVGEVSSSAQWDASTHCRAGLPAMRRPWAGLPCLHSARMYINIGEKMETKMAGHTKIYWSPDLQLVFASVSVFAGAAAAAAVTAAGSHGTSS